jgi:hypothetical protein
MHVQFPLVHLLHLVQLTIDPVEAAQFANRGVGRPECLLIPSQRPLVRLHRLTQLALVSVEADQIVQRSKCHLLNIHLTTAQHLQLC